MYGSSVSEIPPNSPSQLIRLHSGSAQTGAYLAKNDPNLGHPCLYGSTHWHKLQTGNGETYFVQVEESKHFINRALSNGRYFYEFLFKGKELSRIIWMVNGIIPSNSNLKMPNILPSKLRAL